MVETPLKRLVEVSLGSLPHSPTLLLRFCTQPLLHFHSTHPPTRAHAAFRPLRGTQTPPLVGDLTAAEPTRLSVSVLSPPPAAVRAVLARAGSPAVRAHGSGVPVHVGGRGRRHSSLPGQERDTGELLLRFWAQRRGPSFLRR